MLSQYYLLPDEDPGLSNADAILAYERYPLKARLPVIWITGPTDLEKLRRRGVSQREIDREITFKRNVNERAAATILTSESKKRHFDEVIQPRKPTYVIPFFQAVEGICQDAFDQKWAELSEIKLLFIGRAAKRKGLPLLIEAYIKLRQRYAEKFSLHVISNFADGPVDIPSLPGLSCEREVDHPRALQRMRASHYFIMPSEEESYGWVYVEAMAQGAIPVATDHPVQRDILGNGRAGHLIARTAQGVADVLVASVRDGDSARALAAAGRELWENQFSPSVIAARFADLAHGLEDLHGLDSRSTARLGESYA